MLNGCRPSRDPRTPAMGFEAPGTWPGLWGSPAQTQPSASVLVLGASVWSVWFPFHRKGNAPKGHPCMITVPRDFPRCSAVQKGWTKTLFSVHTAKCANEETLGWQPCCSWCLMIVTASCQHLGEMFYFPCADMEPTRAPWLLAPHRPQRLSLGTQAASRLRVEQKPSFLPEEIGLVFFRRGWGVGKRLNGFLQFEAFMASVMPYFSFPHPKPPACLQQVWWESNRAVYRHSPLLQTIIWEGEQTEMRHNTKAGINGMINKLFQKFSFKKIIKKSGTDAINITQLCLPSWSPLGFMGSKVQNLGFRCLHQQTRPKSLN